MKMIFTTIFALVTAEVLIEDETDITKQTITMGATMYNEWSISLEAIVFHILKLTVNVIFVMSINNKRFS